MILPRFMAGAVRAIGTGAAETVFERPELETLFRCYARDVHRLVSRLLGPGSSESDLDDLTQQVFLAAHGALPRFRGTAHPRTWLFGIALRTVYKEIRTRTRHRRMIVAAERMVRVSLESTVSREAEVRAELARAWRCVLELPAKKRIVFILHDLEGMSGREIAEALEIKEGTVHTRLYHARRALAALLDADVGQRASPDEVGR
jgi:RNA polymerase sigma-70 factor (ECF subfamily)